MSDARKNAFEVVWRVENLESWFRSRKDSLYSPQFLVESISNTRWKLSLSSSLHLGERYLGLALHRNVEDNGPEFVALNYELAVLAWDESDLNSKSGSKKFASKTVSPELNVKEIEILEENKEIYMYENVLTVRCKLWKIWSTISNCEMCSIRSVIGTKSMTLNSTINNCSRIIETSNVTVNFISSSENIFISFNAYNGYDGFELKRMEAECEHVSVYSCKLYVILNEEGQLGDIFFNDDPAALLIPYNPYKFKSIGCDLVTFVERFSQNDKLKLQLCITYFPAVISENIDKVKNCKNVAKESGNVENWKTSIVETVKRNLNLSEYKDTPCDIENNGCSEENKCPDNTHLPSTTLINDLTSLYKNRLFCDTKLQTDNETFPAHRNILSARSPVFEKMFSTEMKEKMGECINITDISSDTIRRILQFIYTDSTGPLEMQSAKDLYIASDKYDIVSLKQQCISFMKDNLSPSNVCEVLVLADMHQDKNLESAAQEFVLMYDKEVLGSEEWKSFMKEFSGIAAQVMYLKFMKE